MRVTIDRPEARNALTGPMWQRLARLIGDFDADPDDRVFILSGAGGCFCAGGDISGAGSDGGDGPTREDILERMRSTVTAVCLAIHRARKPVVAAVDGVAAGAGANIAFGCDLVIASERTRFCEIFIRHGLTVDSGGTWLLPRLVGPQKAKELAFLGDWIDAGEAHRLGLVNAVVPAAGFADAVEEWAMRLARQSPAAIGAMKAAIDGAFGRSFAEALDEEAEALAARLTSPEVREAIRAFFEERRERKT